MVEKPTHMEMLEDTGDEAIRRRSHEFLILWIFLENTLFSQYSPDLQAPAEAENTLAGANAARQEV